MGFDSLPSHNLQIPTFNPAVVTQLPKQSIWPGLAQGLAGGVGTLAKALDPVGKAQKKLALAQIGLQTKALEDFQSGKYNSSDFYMGPNGLPVRYTPSQKLDLENKKQIIEQRKIKMGYDQAVHGANQGDPRYTHASEFDSLLPQGDQSLMPAEPDTLPGTESQPERMR